MIKSIIIIELKSKDKYQIFCSTKDEVNLYIDELDSDFEPYKIEIEE